MTTFLFSIRRLVFAGALALSVAAAAAAPSIGVYAGLVPTEATMADPAGDFSDIPGNPDLPAVNEPGGGGAIPCTGADSGTCIGLAEDDQSQPIVDPHSTIGSSPTVHGSIG